MDQSRDNLAQTESGKVALVALHPSDFLASIRTLSMPKATSRTG
jgi:hypothetical protein